MTTAVQMTLIICVTLVALALITKNNDKNGKKDDKDV